MWAVASARFAGAANLRDLPAAWSCRPETLAPAPTPSTGDALHRKQGDDLDGVGRHAAPVTPACDDKDRAPTREHGLFDAASYLKSDRMLWLFWFAIESA